MSWRKVENVNIFSFSFSSSIIIMIRMIMGRPFDIFDSFKHLRRSSNCYPYFLKDFLPFSKLLEKLFIKCHGYVTYVVYYMWLFPLWCIISVERHFISGNKNMSIMNMYNYLEKVHL